MTTTTTTPATQRQTFALFCATGKDWRSANLSMELASAMISAAMAFKGNKPAALEVASKIAKGESVDLSTLPAPAPKNDWQALYDEADKAGKDAANACNPLPMVVGEAKSIFSNEIDRSKPMHYVADGVCGFAWVNVKPGNSAFAKWLKAKKLARKDEYYGGVCVWVGAYNQSMQRKEAYAYAFARVLNDKGIKAYARSRMD